MARWQCEKEVRAGVETDAVREGFEPSVAFWTTAL